MRKYFIKLQCLLLIIFGIIKGALKIIIVVLDVLVWRLVKEYFNKISLAWQVSLTINLLLALGWLIAADCGKKAMIYFAVSMIIASVLVLYPVAKIIFKSDSASISDMK